MNYWQECISEAFDEAGIVATKEQIETVAECVEGAHDNYDMAFGHDSAPNPLIRENETIKQELKDEQRKIRCEYCKGTGKVPRYGGEDSCFKCKGSGRVFTNR